MIERIDGKIYVVGKDINTDLIIPARYMTTMNPVELGRHAMEDLDPKEYPAPFLNRNGSCDYKVIVAGKNFGCGSSREHAPIALRAAGIQAVVAPSFARIFYRNCVNGGLILPLESYSDLSSVLQTGDEVTLFLGELKPVLECALRAKDFGLKSFGPVLEIIEAGGLTPRSKKRLSLA